MAAVTTQGVELSVYDLKEDCLDVSIRDLSPKHFKDKVRDHIRVNKNVKLILVLKSNNSLELKDWCCNQIKKGGECVQTDP